jgi:YD repeat-containing protein
MGVWYKELFALPGRQYALGAPVILEEAAQVLDQLTGRVYVRLLLQSIGQKPLSEVAVTVRWQDGEVQNHTWENPDGPLLIPAPYREARPFALTVDRVVADAVWRGTDAPLKPLPEPALLETVLSPEQAAQYRESYGDGCKWVPERWEDLYLCSCGAVSRDALCGVCGKRTPMLTPAVLQDLEDMIAERRERERREQEEALARQLREQEEARLRLEEAKRRKRARCMRMLRIAGVAAAVVVCLAVLAAVGFYHVTRIAIPKDHYEKALAALEQGNYQEAHRQFTLAGKYEDAEEYLSRFSTPQVTTMYRVKSSQNGKWTSNAYETVNTYDHRELLLDSVTVSWHESEQGAWEKTREDSYSYTYDEDGNPLERRSEGDLVERMTYDARGSLLTKEVLDDAGNVLDTRVCTYQYDEAGRVVLSMAVHTYEGSADMNNTVTRTFVYNADGSLAQQDTLTVYEKDTRMNNRLTESWTYCEDGQVARYIRSYIFTGENRWSRTETQTFAYDGDGRVILETEEIVHHPQSNMEDVVVSIRTAYNENGDVIRKENTLSSYNSPENNSAEIYSATYDREGKLLEEKEEHIYADIETHFSLGWTKTNRYEYDLLGRLTKKKEHVQCPAGSDRGEYKLYVTTVYTYDSDGMLREAVEKQKSTNPQELDAQNITVYNANGLPEKVSFATEVYESVSEYTYAYFYDPDGEK